MAEVKENPQLEIDELTDVFEEYKNRIDYVVQREQKRRLELAEQESSNIISDAWRKAQSMIAEAQERSQQISNEMKQKAREEADRITLEAKNSARQIMKEIDENIRKEAKERTKREIDRIISSERQAAQKQAAEILAQSRKEAEQITYEVTETAKAQARKESALIIAEAREMAKKVNNQSMVRITEMNGLLTEVMQKAENIFEQFRTDLQADFTDLFTILARAKDNLEQRNTNGESAEAGATEANGKAGESRPFEGRRELKIAPPWDDTQIKRLVEFLQRVPSIRVAGQSGNEEDVTIYVDIVEAIPLLTILREMPLVVSSYAQGDTIILRLKNSRIRN
jgi:F0F1-type ATP synthase membrane subunit b/b'